MVAGKHDLVLVINLIDSTEEYLWRVNLQTAATNSKYITVPKAYPLCANLHKTLTTYVILWFNIR
jgi:hypothetical protein